MQGESPYINSYIFIWFVLTYFTNKIVVTKLCINTIKLTISHNTVSWICIILIINPIVETNIYSISNTNSVIVDFFDSHLNIKFFVNESNKQLRIYPIQLQQLRIWFQ